MKTASRRETSARVSARARGDAALVRGDAGYVMVLTALIIIPLFAFTAFAVDLGAWYSQAAKLQRTADSAALAGAVWASDPAGKWQSVAVSSAAANGYTTDVNTSVQVQRLGDTSIKVTIRQRLPQYFSSMFLHDPIMTRSSTGEYQRPLQMGSPENRLGSDPDLGYQPYYWLNTGSDTTTKANGDRFTSRNCANGAWNCNSGVNSEYRQSGYTYHVAVDPALINTDLNIEIYDPAYTFTGDICDSIYISSSDMAAVQTVAASRYGEDAATAALRYGRSTYCPGDQSLGNGTAPNTTYMVRAPDLTPFDDTDNPALCAITFDGRKPSSNTALRDLLIGSGSATPKGREQAVFSDHYHRWFRVCSVPASMVSSLATSQNGGEFVIQVTTSASLSSPPAPRTVASSTLNLGSLSQYVNPGTGGYNRYSLRAGYGTAGAAGWDAGITAFGPTRLPIYVNGVNVANGTPKSSVPSAAFAASFYVTRITETYAGNILQLSFWDIGDVSGSPGSVDFTLTSPDSSVTSQLLTGNNCAFKRDGVTIGSSNGYNVTISGCQISGLRSGSGDPSSNGFNGRLVSVNIPIPTNYTCNEGDPETGCWIKVSATYRGVPSDTTTWSAVMLGDPVHLTD